MKSFLENDNVTTAICLLVIGVGFYALESDFSFFNYTNTNGSNANSIGLINSVESDVRLKNSKSIFWSNARKDDLLAQGDSLFVGPDSNIVIKFSDGNSITIGSNSLIKFKQENKKIKLNLQYGSIKSENLPSQIVLDDCGQSLDIRSKNASLEIGKSTECGKIQVKSKKGEVRVNNKVVQQHEELVIDKAPIAQLIEKPEVNQTIVQLEQLAVPVSLNNELDLKNDFASDSRQPAQEDNKPDPIALLQEKINEEVKFLKPPELVKSKTTFPAGSSSPTTISWKRADLAVEYILETSATPDFANVSTTRTTQNEITLNTPIQDSLYYRLKSVGKTSAISADYSQTGIIEATYPSIKLRNDVISYDYLAKNSKDIPKEKSFSLNWNEIPNAEKYLVQVDTDENFSSPQEFTARGPASVIKVPGAGKYNVRVSAYNSQSRKISSTSKVGEIIYNRIFDLQAPSIETSYTNLVYIFQKGLGKFIWLKWNALQDDKGDSKYKIEVAKDDSFSQIVKTYYTKKNRVLIQEQLPEGKYFWRVRTETGPIATPQSTSDWSNLGLIQISTPSQQL